MQPAAEQQIELEDVVSSSSDKAPLTKEASAEKSRATVPSAGKRRHFMRAVIGFVALVAIIGIVSVDRGGCHGGRQRHAPSTHRPLPAMHMPSEHSPVLSQPTPA